MSTYLFFLDICLFMRIKKRLIDVKYTRGVTRIIGVDLDVPTPIPDKQILDIKSIMESDVKLDPFPYMKKGRAVTGKVGASQGVRGYSC